MNPDADLVPNLKPRWGGRRATPTILQMETTECAAACLGMILAHHGRWVPLEELRIGCGVSRDGANAASMVRAAREYGLVAQGVPLLAEGPVRDPVPDGPLLGVQPLRRARRDPGPALLRQRPGPRTMPPERGGVRSELYGHLFRLPEGFGFSPGRLEAEHPAGPPVALRTRPRRARLRDAGYAHPARSGPRRADDDQGVRRRRADRTERGLGQRAAGRAGAGGGRSGGHWYGCSAPSWHAWRPSSPSS